MTEITRSGMYEEMVQDIIDNDELLYMLRASNAKVVCVVSDNVKVDESKRRVYAEIEKIPAKYESFINADAMIIIYTPNIASFSPAKKKIVLFIVSNKFAPHSLCLYNALKFKLRIRILIKQTCSHLRNQK